MKNLVHPHILFSGIGSGILYFAILSGYIVGILVYLLPMFPLFWVGCRYGAHALSYSSIIAFLILIATTETTEAIFWTISQLIPTWLFGRQLLKARVNSKGELEWYPVGSAITTLTGYGIIILGLGGLYLMEQELLPVDLIPKEWSESGMMDPALIEHVKQTIQTQPYLLFNSYLWIWVVMTYGTAYFTHFVCSTFGHALRASIAITSFFPPYWWPVLIGIFGLTGILITSPYSFIPQTLFLALLFPYGFVGLAKIHEKAKTWENPIIWLVCIYVIIALSPILLICFAVWAFIHHVLLIFEKR